MHDPHSHLASIEENLMLILLHVEDLLEHIVQLFLTEQRFRLSQLTRFGAFARVVFTTDLIELEHPRCKDRLLEKRRSTVREYEMRVKERERIMMTVEEKKVKQWETVWLTELL